MPWNKSQSSVLLTIDTSAVSTQEFIYFYNKNNFNSDQIDDKQSIDDYLQLFIKFKLKVREAYALRFDQRSSYQKELEGYRKQLVKPYLSEQRVIDSLISEGYQRLNKEVKATHILIRLDSRKSGQDTVEAYQKISELRARAMKGENFGLLAQQYSHDPTAKANQGNLGYFTAFQMVYDFETSAYNTPVGQISHPFRTNYGYHIVKVEDIRPSQGKVKVSHIMVKTSKTISVKDSIDAAQKIFTISQQLDQGSNWNEMCELYSEDNGTKRRGGSLPWFGTRDMAPGFEQASFALTGKGDISSPVRSPYGWHIIKLEDKRPLEPFDSLRNWLTTKVKSASRSKITKRSLISRLKKENQYLQFYTAKQLALEKADTNLTRGKWNHEIDSSVSDQIIFQLKDESNSIFDFFYWLEANQKPKANISARAYMEELLEKFTEEHILRYEEQHLEDKYFDFKMLLKEYREGILLFDLMDTIVWSKAAKDTLGLKKYYQDSIHKYQWQERADLIILSSPDTSVLKEASALLKSGTFPLGTPINLTPEAEQNMLNGENRQMLSDIVKQLGKGRWLLISGNFQTKIKFTNLSLVTEYLKNHSINENQYQVVDNTDSGQDISIAIYSSNVEDLEMSLKQEKPLGLKVESGLYERGNHPLLNEIIWKVGEQTIVKNNRNYLIIAKNILPPQSKSLDEIRGIVISDYQNLLEHEWVESLRKKYQTTINNHELKKIYSQLGGS
ncbi:MAG: peptidylprolyl isomerase [Bacteroidetes bacterium]|nr:peptidylprolyl isomerase [Bacteroidota bacterium]